jgi:hypothetical protein
MSWHATVLTIFPEMLPGPLAHSLAGKALEAGLWRLETVDIRGFARDKHRSVDDAPFGGGPGMVLRPDVLDAAIDGADAIMMLRIQLERQGRLSFPSLREYYNTFGLTPDRLRRAKEGVIVMHPGPMNRGVEIASDVADGPWSVILDQVTNGVAVRMAVLYLLGGAHATE